MDNPEDKSRVLKTAPSECKRIPTANRKKIELYTQTS